MKYCYYLVQVPQGIAKTVLDYIVKMQTKTFG